MHDVSLMSRFATEVNICMPACVVIAACRAQRAGFRSDVAVESVRLYACHEGNEAGVLESYLLAENMEAAVMIMTMPAAARTGTHCPLMSQRPGRLCMAWAMPLHWLLLGGCLWYG